MRRNRVATAYRFSLQPDTRTSVLEIEEARIGGRVESQVGEEAAAVSSDRIPDT